VAALGAALGWYLDQFAFGTGLTNISYDLLHVTRFRHVPAGEAVIVYLDEKSHLDLNQPLNVPWDRAIHAHMIDRLTAAGARAVVMDIVFSDPSRDNPGADRKLADAIKRNGHVILAADNVPAPGAVGMRKFIPPFALLRDAAADFGSDEMLPSRDLTVRAHAPNEQVASLSWAAAAVVDAPVTKRLSAEQFQPSPDTRGGSIKSWIQYYGPPDWLPHVSYSDALVPGRVPDAAFSNRVVFIGSRIITKLQNERNDEYRNPYSFWVTQSKNKAFIAGVEVQATMFLNLLRGDWLRRMPDWLEATALVLFGAGIGYALMRVRPLPAILTALVVAAAVAFISRALFMRELIWVPWLIALVQVGFALAVSVSVNSVRLYVENRLYAQSLSLYLSPKLVKKFARGGDRSLLQPGAEKQKLTIMFSDIAGLTSIAEGMDSDELARLMNQYFQAAVADCIHPTDGTVVKYIGDAIFAFWNAPEPQRDHALRACAAALRFRELARRKIGGRTLLTLIGLHTGVANVGNFGSAARIDYTAIGENINLASRMEGLNKFLGTEVLITGATRKEIGDRFVTRRLGDFKLKGFEKTVSVYELMALKADEEKTRTLRDEFACALQLFQTADLYAAELAFRRILEHSPNDGPTLFYLAQVEAGRANPPDRSWDGAVELAEK